MKLPRHATGIAAVSILLAVVPVIASAEVPMTRIDGFVIEYGCHEGNYGLANILAGARAEERSQSR